MATPADRREQTGSPPLDRIQRFISEIRASLKSAASSLALLWLTVNRTYGVGITRINLNNANLVIADTDQRFLCGQIVFVGTLTAARTVTLPNATDATAYLRWLVNVTGGGFAITIKTKDGSFSLPNGGHYAVWVSVSGPSAESTG